MFVRDISPEFEDALRSYPIVTMTGPRQSGKTTLVQMLAADKPYFNLEKPDIRQVVYNDPVTILKDYPQGAIFDEVQHVPELLSYLQVAVDENKKNGLYILTGSHQPELHAAISQSLAGRTAILHLLPLSIKELSQAGIDQSLNEYLLKGFLPRIYDQKINPTKHYRNYLETYIEKDVRQLINLKDLMLFQKFLKLCAGRIGQVLNMASLGNEIGISNHTVTHWLSIMQASYVITLLPPYFENFGKRMIKSPKLYFFDVGLAAFLLDIDQEEQLNRDPLRGNLIENLVVMDLYKARYNQGLNPNLYYYRDTQQQEIDIIYKRSNELIPVEIKAAQTINQSFFRSLSYFEKLIGDRFSKGYLVYTGSQELSFKNFSVVNYKNSANIVMGS